MSRIQIIAGLLLLGLVAGCKAQPAPQASGSTLDRHIEVMVRSQFNVPPDYDVVLGERKPSAFPGYESLAITLTHGTHKVPVEFLISTDNRTLARLETFDLNTDPAFHIDVTNRPVRGNPQAKVTIINYDDLACPYCAKMHATLFPATLDHYKDRIRIIYKDNPLTGLHPWAMHAAVDSNCLAAQSSTAYWAYVDYIHSHGQEINGEDRSLAKSFDALNRIARQQAILARLDEKKLDQCIATQDETAVKAAAAEAAAMRVDGAPFLFIEGERINGALPQEYLWRSIDRALKAAGVDVPPQTEDSSKTSSDQAGASN